MANTPHHHYNIFATTSSSAKNYYRVVIVLGSYTRLTHAGLGCPDWPGCYSKLVPPHSATERAVIQQHFPDQPIQATKTWTEMVHRYVATTIGTFVLVLVLQIILGILNVVAGLPLFVVVAHTGVAALLLLTMAHITHCVFKAPRETYV